MQHTFSMLVIFFGLGKNATSTSLDMRMGV
jgi:hypothetical protein